MPLDNATDGHPSSKLTRHKFPDPSSFNVVGRRYVRDRMNSWNDRGLSVNIVQRGQGWKTRNRFQFSFDEGGGCSGACPQILFLSDAKGLPRPLEAHGHLDERQLDGRRSAPRYESERASPGCVGGRWLPDPVVTAPRSPGRAKRRHEVRVSGQCGRHKNMSTHAAPASRLRSPRVLLLTNRL